jgi:serine/threonine protein kinase
MDAQKWANAKSLLADAAALPASARRSFVETHCHDSELLRELLTLLGEPAPLSQLLEPSGGFRVGERLGPFEILGLIGAGAMGQVYKARDTRLDHIVAIKLLPSAEKNRGRAENGGSKLPMPSTPHIQRIVHRDNPPALHILSYVLTTHLND